MKQKSKQKQPTPKKPKEKPHIYGVLKPHYLGGARFEADEYWTREFARDEARDLRSAGIKASAKKLDLSKLERA